MKSKIPDQILSSVYKISTLLTEPSSVDKVLKAIVETVKKDLKFNRCSVYLINKESKKLECKYITGFSLEKETFVMQRPFDLTKHSCIETKVAHTGEPILIKNFHSNKNISELDRVISCRMERGCTLYVPLKIKGDVIGILGVDKKHNEPEINEKEFESLSILATYVSVIIENSRLVEALLKEKRFSENVLNSSINGILTTDIYGRITSLNPAAEDILHVTNAAVINRLIWDIIDSSDWSKNTTNVYKRNEIRKGWEFNLNDTQDKIIDISVSPIMNEGDDFIGFVYFIQDITVERRQYEYLQRMNRLIALGELAAGVAHEIRNPLTGIAVVLDILMGKKRLTKNDNDLISQANMEIERLDKLISDLLIFAKPKQFDFEFANMNDVMRSICFLINEKCNKHNIVLKTRLHENIPNSYMDHERIKQGLLNVVINAIQAMPKGGNLLLETDVNIENNTVTERNIIIKVGDTGVGIAKEDISRIFDPFFTTHNDGTGLGLSITHSIIKAHHGFINVDSENGKGTQIAIYLPQDCRKSSKCI